jgi:hypothetical protein
MGHVLDVRGPLAEVGIVSRLEGRTEPSTDDLDGILRPIQTLPDGAGNLTDQRWILEDESMGLEDCGLLCTHREEDLLVDLEDLVPRLGDGLVKAFQLGLDSIRRDGSGSYIDGTRAQSQDPAVHHAT